MIIGFTGTRAGMSEKQKGDVKLFLKLHPPTFTVHGDCVGADREFDSICEELDIPTRCCPSDMASMRAHTGATILQEPKPPLERNHDIVDAASELLACPKEMREVTRSGTWATVRYARKVGKTVHVFYPNI